MIGSIDVSHGYTIAAPHEPADIIIRTDEWSRAQEVVQVSTVLYAAHAEGGVGYRGFHFRERYESTVSPSHTVLEQARVWPLERPADGQTDQTNPVFPDREALILTWRTRTHLDGRRENEPAEVRLLIVETAATDGKQSRDERGDPAYWRAHADRDRIAAGLELILAALSEQDAWHPRVQATIDALQ